ncbi:MAG: hypothetical protein ACTHK8_10230 [Ginsengibacter sp.]
MLYGPASYKENYTTQGNKIINLSLDIESGFPEDGNTMITVNTSRSAFFPLGLRVPSWTSSFTAEVGGQKYKGAADEYLVIKRIWKTGDKIKVTFNIPVRILSGGKNYPGQLAFQRGPQVLAFDNSLNGDLLKKFDLGSAQKLSVEMPANKSDVTLLPRQWIGNQAYKVNIIKGNSNTKDQQLVMVPFADASQTGGDVKVWLPLEVMNKSKNE